MRRRLLSLGVLSTLVIGSLSPMVAQPAQAAGTVNGPLLNAGARTLDSVGKPPIPLPMDMRLGNSMDFAPDGASLVGEDFFTHAIIARRADGSTVSLGSYPVGSSPTFVSWAGGSGQYAVVVLTDTDSDVDTLWRYQTGSAPSRLATLESNGASEFAADAHSTRFVFEGADDDLMSIDTDTGVRTELTDFCDAVPDGADCTKGNGTTVDGVLDINPADGAILVSWSRMTETSDFNGFGWLTPGETTPTQWLDYSGQSYASGGIVSPDGTQVALPVFGSWTTTDTTQIRSAEPGAAVIGQLPDLHAAWQPCPTGSCPVFVGPTVPGAPKVGRAYPGATDTEITATVSWGTAPNTGPPVSHYQVDVARLTSTRTIAKHTRLTGPATARKGKFWLSPTRYKFRVRASNELGWGPWSAYSNIVRAR